MQKITSVKGPLPGPRGKAILDSSARFEAGGHGYQAPVVWDRASGVVVTDVDGNRFIDWTSGVLVTNVGHCHPRLVQAIKRASEQVLNTYEFATEARVRLAERLVEVSPPHLTKAFFLTTGSDATEAALRIARRHSGNYEIVSFLGGFHGRTGDARSAGGMGGVRRGYGPPMPGYIHVPYPYCYRCPFHAREGNCGFLCLEFADEIVTSLSTGSLAGLIVEPYQGAAGFIFPPEGYLRQLEAWVRERDIVFILDEVQSSYGRTGKFFAMEWESLTPDVVCIGKGIGSGVPISAIAATDEVLGGIDHGDLGSTLGGNPFSCASAMAVLDIMEDENLAGNARRIGAMMKQRLTELVNKSEHVGDVRGRGLVMGVEFVRDKQSKEPAPEMTRQVIDRCADSGVLIGKVGVFSNVIRVAPPLVVTEAEAAESLEIFEEVVLGL